MPKYRCTICGYIHEGQLTEDFKCPVYKKPVSVFELIEEKENSANIYSGTKTEENLMEAFGEREGYDQLSELFLKTARNEQEHARIWFEELGNLDNSSENLLHAVEGENY